jgi:hypothetical protein
MQATNTCFQAEKVRITFTNWKEIMKRFDAKPPVAEAKSS